MTDRDDRFRPIEDLPGKLYIPRPGRPRKHPCADCFSCQWCADNRCRACREGEVKSSDESDHGQD